MCWNLVWLAPRLVSSSRLVLQWSKLTLQYLNLTTYFVHTVQSVINVISLRQGGNSYPFFLRPQNPATQLLLLLLLLLLHVHYYDLLPPHWPSNFLKTYAYNLSFTLPSTGSQTAHALTPFRRADSAVAFQLWFNNHNHNPQHSTIFTE